LVRHNAQHMGQLIDDLLTFSRPSRQPLTLQRVACADLARQVLADLGEERVGRRVDIAIGDLSSWTKIFMYIIILILIDT